MKLWAAFLQPLTGGVSSVIPFNRFVFLTYHECLSYYDGEFQETYQLVALIPVHLSLP